MKLYGVPGSRALRSIWAAEETGVDYEFVSTHFIEDSKKPDYLALNPNGRIPTLVDGDLVLFESMAINLYLAKAHGGDLYPSDDADEARAIQWSFWGMTELEPVLMQMVLHKVMLPEDQRWAVVAVNEIVSVLTVPCERLIRVPSAPWSAMSRSPSAWTKLIAKVRV